MEFLNLIFIFIFGTIAGSFLNVCIFRMPQDKSIVFPGSFCPKCEKKIRWYDNIPLLSYLALGGQCRFCKGKIPFRYFFVELITGITAAALFWYFNSPIIFTYYFIFAGLLIIVFFIDLDHKLIFDIITCPGTALGIIGSALLPKVLLNNSCGFFFWDANSVPVCNLLHSAAGAALAAAFFYAVRFLGTLMAGREAMGLGDVKLAMLIGSYLGWQKSFVSFFIAFFIGALAALFLMIFFKKKGKDEIPFGTFMAIGALFSVFGGDILINLYINDIFFYK